MALNSFDDKLLGEKVEYYCSSSEDESEKNSDDCKDDTEGRATAKSDLKFIPHDEVKETGKRGAIQTGPKGVIRDWRHYKKLESEARERTALERKQLINKLSLTCDPKKDTDTNEELDENDEEFLKWYNKKRILELQKKFASRWIGIAFGKLKELTAEDYVEAIENEKNFVTIIIHIYENNVPACEAMTGCLQILAKEYLTVKFCQIKASEARLSRGFKQNGLPALLAYKNNTIIGNFVHVSETLTDDFFASDVEAYLKSYGLLTEKKSSFGASCDSGDDSNLSDED